MAIPSGLLSQICCLSGVVFSSFSGYFLVSFLGLGPLWDNLICSLEFNQDFDFHFEILLGYLYVFLLMHFLRIFVFVQDLFFPNSH